MTKNKDAMKLRFDFNNMMSDFVGSEQGFTDEDLTKNAAFAKPHSTSSRLSAARV